MTVSEKVAYLKGLADGLGIKDSTNEGKLMLAVIDVLEAMADDIEAVDAHAKDLSDSISDISEDMEYLEDLCIGDMDDDDEDYDEIDDDDDDADVCTGCCGSCGEAGKSNALKQVFADMDLMTDGAVCAGTVMAGFRCDIGNRGQHNKCQHYGQQARHKTKFLCHGLPSFAIL